MRIFTDIVLIAISYTMKTDEMLPLLTQQVMIAIPQRVSNRSHPQIYSSKGYYGCCEIKPDFFIPRNHFGAVYFF